MLTSLNSFYLMETITISLADVAINLRVNYPSTMERLRDFVASTGASDLVYNVSQDRIDEELVILQKERPTKIVTREEAEYNVLYRDLSDLLWTKGILLYHGVLIEMDGYGFLFTAPSGTGKSTHAELWSKLYYNRAHIINGDKPLLKLNSDGVYAYGSPWKGKENIGVNSKVKLKAICHLRRGQTNNIQNVTQKPESVSWLFNQVSLKSRDRHLPELLAWFNKCLRYVSLYELMCNTQQEAASVAYEAMK